MAPQSPLDPSGPSVLIALRLTAQMAARLKHEARSAGETVSAFVRRLLDEHALYASGIRRPNRPFSGPAGSDRKGGTKSNRSGAPICF